MVTGLTDRVMNAVATVREDLAAARRRDPAATDDLTVLLTSPGLHAIWTHRVAHRLWARGAKLPAMVVAQGARSLTGVEIHPGAAIGRRFFIDHGMGVVIGETAEVGDDVMLYHGVTLGGRSMERTKRHPTVEDSATIGAGARVIGPVVVGRGAQVGANAVVVKDVPELATAVGVPAQVRTGAAHPEVQIDPAIWI
ncbi:MULTISPECIES: serine O-acetyltransferase EpsC [Brachybacterium]|uniref:Serine acetyltransferase n=1 Tax=Brachybacterium alimentarium TaxID=47845 RepID=A0A2A3YK73_9MICO|nr:MULTISPECIES: serine O-acetyltransferase EpsC [Brachybacterium]PCC31608.1 serine O-acetyltransferase [Brachybacterium alimentarium]PCC39693.1 serine O-acetyltransferase [Brachybacterium alimentarium]RCS65208.1 serine O-acetyltransferase [Brachybacterium sp. JB7]RCS69778.1 serine O-acetyltransferase [Brachybacterium alimentarium]RCS75793.1 serine O-acetyltransferase [Brachybacterium alimentarium]